GHDFGPYAEWMEQHRISRRHVLQLKNEFTAQAYITTDLEDNQITAFHPGAMNFSSQNQIPTDGSITLGIVAPDSRDAMIAHARAFHDGGIPFMFDPGQGLPLFDGDDLMNFVSAASWIAVNDYEAQLVQERTGLSPEELAGHVEALVVTRGGEGSLIYTNGECLQIPCARAATVADPTGCGDAYRAGLLFGIMKQLPWPVTGRIASLLGAIKVEEHGTQNHRFDWAQFTSRYQQSFGEELAI
ncbi:MAG: carbohydrate kinase family protein, partial [Gammaproteobacteria bacterium]|nr:carbohydrate kinase family protein [Gammaproteobacteria bacterium]